MEYQFPYCVEVKEAEWTGQVLRLYVVVDCSQVLHFFSIFQVKNCAF